VEHFKYLRKTLTNQSFIHEYVKSRLNMGNSCYHSVQNLYLPASCSKIVMIKIYGSVILPVVICGYETWSLILREEDGSKLFGNRVLRKTFRPKRDEVTREWRRLRSEELYGLYFSPNIIRVIKSKRMRWAKHIARMGERTSAYQFGKEP
jgi:hypothetical protein